MQPGNIAARWFAGKSPQYWALALLLVAAFAFGGGSRGDIRSLMVLRPLAALLLGYGLLGLTRAKVAENRYLFGMALAIIGLLVLHLMPMPPGWWRHLPGRDLVSQIDLGAGLGMVWRPLSLAPDATLNALFASVLPLAVLVLGVQLDTRERHALLGLVLVLGGISALLGLAQNLGGQNSALRFYKVTNDTGAVGLFANRNHQALMLAMLLPMIAAWAAGSASGKGRFATRTVLGLLAGFALLPLILITGSRAGLILATVAMFTLPVVIVRSPARLTASGRDALRDSDRRRGLLPMLSVGLVCLCLIGLTIWLGKGVAVNRLLSSSPSEDLRYLIIPTMLTMSKLYFPLGSGFGSFEKVYQVHEPSELIIVTYANHAHNDWLEIALTGGVPALLILLAAVIGFLAKARLLFWTGIAPSGELRFARLGLVVILLSGLASLGDYPLRVPSLACFFVVALLWIGCPLPKNQPIALPS